MPEFIVTPWEVRGKIDYDKLIRDFGVKQINRELLEKLREFSGDLHLFLRRNLFFAHRDLDKILNDYENGKEFFLYTGRGPSGHTHIGHLVPWIFTKWLQDVFNVDLYFQITDDEKYLVKRKNFDEIQGYVKDNLLDIIAVGFDPDKTYIIINTRHISYLYKIAVEIAKRITFSTAKAVFGFEDSSNIGIIFFPALQAAPCFLPCYLKGKKINCLIPAAIDQDPYWRGVAREIAIKLGMPKPAQIHSKFIPGLGKHGKMSSSEPETCIFTTDGEEDVKRKIWNAFTGGASTVKEQREKGGRPEICMVYQYLFYLFEEDDRKIEEIKQKCKNGEILCGECKEYLAKKVVRFLKEHQKRREKAKDKIEDYMIDKIKTAL